MKRYSEMHMNDIKRGLGDLDPVQKAALAQALKKRIESKKKEELEAADFDVVVLGGGLAGSTLARQIILEKPDVKILVLERKAFPCPEVAFKVGESASELQAHYFGKMLNLKDHFSDKQIKKGGARYFFSHMDNSDITRRVEVGVKNFPTVPSYQFDRGRLETFLFEDNTRLGITYWEQCKVEDVQIGSPQRITLKRDKEDVQVSARWVVDASGRAAVLKRKLGLAENTEHAANAAWFRIPGTVNIEKWSSDTTWQSRTKEGLRCVSTTHFMGKGYWVWLIVLPTNATSIGLVADPDIHPLKTMNRLEHLLTWLKTYEPQLADALEENRDGIDDFTAFKHFSHGCKRVFSPERWCITGDAGVFADPFYSPGGDFIAMGNSLIKDMIIDDLKGNFSAVKIEENNFSFLGLFKLYLLTYQNQYPVMGNGNVMYAKIVWDWAIYWGVNALLFFHGNRAFDTAWLSSVQKEMNIFNQLNTQMQNLFPVWSNLKEVVVGDKMQSLFDLEFLHDMHKELEAGFNEVELKEKLVQNIKILEILAQEFLNQVNDLKASVSNDMESEISWADTLDITSHSLISEELSTDLNRLRMTQLIDDNA